MLSSLSRFPRPPDPSQALACVVSRARALPACSVRVSRALAPCQKIGGSSTTCRPPCQQHSRRPCARRASNAGVGAGGDHLCAQVHCQYGGGGRGAGGGYYDDDDGMTDRAVEYYMMQQQVAVVCVSAEGGREGGRREGGRGFHSRVCARTMPFITFIVYYLHFYVSCARGPNFPSYFPALRSSFFLSLRPSSLHPSKPPLLHPFSDRSPRAVMCLRFQLFLFPLHFFRVHSGQVP